MTAVRGTYSTRARVLAAVLAAGLAGGAIAQDSASNAQPSAASDALRVPENMEIFGKAIPSVVKATALVNGEVITQTDINQRLALLAISNGVQPSAEELDRLRQQVLRNLIDETLQIQAARAAEISVTEKDIDRTVQRVAANAKMTPQQFTDFLKDNGSSIRSIRRQIHGELAWQRLQSAKIENSVSVGDDEVKAVLERLTASKGTQQYRVGEIFLSATRDRMPEAMANANKILEQLRAGASFPAYARQFSEASTAAVGGDLGWVRPEQLPEQIAMRVRQMQPGEVSSPIPLPGGVSIIAVQDARKVLTNDPRAAVMTLKQVSIDFPKGTTRVQAEPTLARFAQAAQNIGGCGGADRIANDFNASVVQAERPLRDLPPVLQEMLLPLQVGQATQPWGNLEEGVKILVVCGRDEVDATQPTFDQVFTQLSEERVNLSARRYLRDLRRDAVIEFR